MISLLKPPLQARANSGLTFRPDANCVLWYPGQDDAHSSTIRDRSGYGNDGTIVGAGWAKNSQGLWVLSFDGSDDRVSCGNDTSLQIASGDVTVIVWESKTVGTSATAVFEKGLWIAGGYGILHSATTTTRFQTGNETDYTQLDITVADSAAWRCFELVAVGSSTLTAYLNGAYKDSAAITHDVASPNQNLFIGNNNADDYDYTGKIALLRVFNRALSAVEIAGIYNQERHLFGV